MKMRMQTHQYTSLKTAVGDTLRHEGILGFYRGMGPPLVTTAALKSVAFTVNEAFKNQLVRGRLDPTPTIVDNFIGGFLSGFLVASIATPIEYLKVQMSLQGLMERERKSDGDHGKAPS